MWFQGVSLKQTQKEGYLRRYPSVITCSQSFDPCVSGHLNKAPDLFVLGCRLSPNGAPTSNLVDTNRMQNKRDNKEIKVLLL